MGPAAGLRSLLKYLAVAVVVLFFGFPIVWTVLTSIKPIGLIPQMPPAWIFEPTLDHYRAIFNQTALLVSLWNSLVVATASTVLALVVGTPAAYALARFHFRGKEELAFYFLTARMAPPMAVILPFFLIARELGLLDTRLILILAYTTFNFAIVIWLLRGFFAEVPREIDEAALVDGCSRFGAFVRVVLPLTMPGLVAAAIICFIFSWNEFLFALVLTRTQVLTYPVQISQYFGSQSTFWAKISAMSVLGTLPVFFAVAAFQRYLVRGISLGAVKG